MEPNESIPKERSKEVLVQLPGGQTYHGLAACGTVEPDADCLRTDPNNVLHTRLPTLGFFTSLFCRASSQYQQFVDLYHRSKEVDFVGPFFIPALCT